MPPRETGNFERCQEKIVEQEMWAILEVLPPEAILGGKI
jgi:hypothetical protein